MQHVSTYAKSISCGPVMHAVADGSPRWVRQQRLQAVAETI